MKLPRKEFLRKCQFPLLIVFATAPIPLFLYAAFAPTLFPFCWAVPTAYALLTILSFLISGKRRLLYGIAASILLLALGASALLAVPSPFLLAVPIFYCLLLLTGLPMAGWDADEELPAFWYWLGILMHIIAQVVKFCAQVFLFTELDVTSPWLLISFFAFAVLAMLALTRSTLSSAANGRQDPPASMRRKNLVLTLVFFAIALLIAMSPAIISAIRAFFAWLKELIARLLESIPEPSTTEPAAAQVTGNPNNEMVMAVEAENGILTKILNAIFYISGCVLTIGVFVVVARKVGKKVYNLLKKLLSNLSDYASNASEDYEDEVTDTRATAPKPKKIRLSAADERGMPPAQRIRYRYRRLLSKHPEWSSGSTARENLPSQAAPLYEKARYSGHPITEEDAACFTSNTKRV